jgi:hypothetical protein
MFCNSCRAQVTSAAKFCTQCGTAIVPPTKIPDAPGPRTVPAVSVDADARERIKWGGVVCGIAAIAHLCDLFVQGDPVIRCGSVALGAACALVGWRLWTRQSFGAAVAGFVLLSLQGLCLGALVIAAAARPGQSENSGVGSLVLLAGGITFIGWKILTSAIELRKAAGARR